MTADAKLTADRVRLAEIRARLEAATPGPWEACDAEASSPYACWRITAGELPLADVGSYKTSLGQDERNAALIASAPQDLAFLLGLAGLFLDSCEDVGGLAAVLRREGAEEMRARAAAFVRKSWGSPNIARELESLPLDAPGGEATS